MTIHKGRGQGCRRGGAGGASAPCLFLRGQRGQQCPSLTVFILILATVFQPENTTEGTLCLKLTQIHLIALLSYQYKAITYQYKQYMIGKEDNKCLLNVVFSALSFLLAPLVLLLLRFPWVGSSGAALQK